MANRHFLLVFFLCSLRSLVTPARANNDVAVLTDANFEHDTQATTGSTTGRWLILFHNQNNHGEAQKLLTDPQPSSEEDAAGSTTMVEDLLEAGVVVGIMDVSANPSTVERLNIPGTPHALILAKGKLYRSNSWEELKDFAISEYEIAFPEDIPSLPSTLDVILSHPNGRMALTLGLAGSLILLAVVLIGCRMKSPPASKTKKKNK